MNTHWNDQTFWATPIVYDALDVFELDITVRVRFVDPDPTFNPRALAGALWIPPAPWRPEGYGLIQCSKYWWGKLTTEERRATLVHETAHVINAYVNGYHDGRTGHGPNWKSIMVRLGEEPTACYQGPATHVLERPKTQP